MEETDSFKSWSFSDLAALLYRDNIKQKHSSRERLSKELSTKKALEEKLVASKSSIEIDARVGDSMVEMLIEHILLVTWLE